MFTQTFRQIRYSSSTLLSHTLATIHKLVTVYSFEPALIKFEWVISHSTIKPVLFHTLFKTVLDYFKQQQLFLTVFDRRLLEPTVVSNLFPGTDLYMQMKLTSDVCMTCFWFTHWMCINNSDVILLQLVLCLVYASLHVHAKCHRMCKSNISIFKKLCMRPPQYAPSPASWPVTFWPWKWCPSHVWRTMYATDRRQTDVRRASSLNASALWGPGIITIPTTLPIITVKVLYFWLCVCLCVSVV